MKQAANSRGLPSAVHIGGMSKPEMLHALHERGVQLNRAAEALFADRRFETSGQQHVIEIEARSVAELGFSEGATHGQLVARALESELIECPLELGPWLRLQFLEQPDMADGMPLAYGRAPPGSMTVLSPPLDETDETPKGFYLRRVNGVLWLRGYWSCSGHTCSPEDILVFSKGKFSAGTLA